MNELKSNRKLTKAQAHETNYVKTNLAQIKGGVITAVGASVPDERGLIWPVLIVTMPSGDVMNVFVSADDEMNGPGALDISRLPL